VVANVKIEAEAKKWSHIFYIKNHRITFFDFERGDEKTLVREQNNLN
jgi:hypothetical protein